MKPASDDSERKVPLSLSADEALVLFEFLSRFTQEDKLQIADEAEKRVLWNILADLESALPEPLAPEYEAKLSEARDRVRRQ